MNASTLCAGYEATNCKRCMSYLLTIPCHGKHFTHLFAWSKCHLIHTCSQCNSLTNTKVLLVLPNMSNPSLNRPPSHTILTLTHNIDAPSSALIKNFQLSALRLAPFYYHRNCHDHSSQLPAFLRKQENLIHAANLSKRMKKAATTRTAKHKTLTVDR